MLLVAAGANAPTTSREAARRIKEAGEIFIVVFLFVDTAIKPSNAVFRECGPLGRRTSVPEDLICRHAPQVFRVFFYS